MFLMFFVFLVEIIFAVLPVYIAQITTLIAQLVFTITKDEMSSRNDIQGLKEEQSQLSITDEFVQYAKLQRQIDKLMLFVKEKGNERKHRIYYLRTVVTIGIYVLHALLALALMFIYRETPLLNVDPSWFAPFGRIVAFPTEISGAVGLGCWLLVSNSVIHRAKTLVKL